MPNHCSNVLIITGKQEDLEKFKKTMNAPDRHGKKNKFSFHHTVPMPSSINAEKGVSADAMLRDDNWYGWSIAHWGTKWDAYEVVIKKNTKTVLKIVFDTAWSPPEAWLAAVGKKFKKLNFKMTFSEQGNAFYGIATVENGKYSNQVIELCGKDFDEEGQPQGPFLEFLEEHGNHPGG